MRRVARRVVALGIAGLALITFVCFQVDFCVARTGFAYVVLIALVSLLGLTHVERNGHHYVNGMAGLPQGEQKRFLNSHDDIYEESHGAVRVRIKGGMIQMKSLDCPGFASRAMPDWDAMRRMP